MKKTILIGLTFVAGIIGIAAVYQRGHHISDELTDPVAGTLPNKAWSQRMTGIMLVRAQNPGEKNAYLDEDKYNKLTSYFDHSVPSGKYRVGFRRGTRRGLWLFCSVLFAILLDGIAAS